MDSRKVKNKKIAVQIVQHTNIEFIKNCLDSILYCNMDDLSVDIYVLDNHTQDGSYEFVKYNYPNIHLIRSESAHGFVWNQNYLFRTTRGKYDFVWVLNNDTIIHKDTLQHLINAFEADPALGVIGPQLYYPNGLEQNSGSNLTFFYRLYTIFRIRNIISTRTRNLIKKVLNKFHSTKKKDIEDFQYVQCISGAAMIVKAEVIEKIGYFDEGFFMYGEDSEYSLRSIKAGYKNAIIRNAKVTHIHAPKYDHGRQYNILYGMFYIMHKYNYSPLYYALISLMLYVKYIPYTFWGEGRKDKERNILKIPQKIKKEHVWKENTE